MVHHPERDHGLGGSPEVEGVPRLSDNQPAPFDCPNCGGMTLFRIEVTVKIPLLVGGKGQGFYVGCAACPYASPMMAVTAGPDPERN